MSLVGSLEDLSLLDILQIVNVSRRTGVLRLAIPGTGTSFVFFSSGNVSDVCGEFSEELFLASFEKQGLVEPAEVSSARALAHGDPVATLRRLVETGALNPPLAEQSRRLEIARRLRHLTQQNHGEFAFSLTESGQDLEGGAPRLGFPLKQAISPQNLLTQALAEASFTEAPGEPPEPAPSTAAKPAARPSASPDELFDSGSFPTLSPAPQETRPAPSTRAPEAPPPVASPKPPEPLPKKGRVEPRSRASAVFVSQDTVFKGLMQRKLQTHFAQIEAVSTLSQYLESCRSFVRQRKRAVGLIDLLMPTLDGKGYLGGLEAVDESSAEFPQVKLILMSDIADEGLLALAKNKGATVLPKPSLALNTLQQFEAAIENFAQTLCREADRLVPPVEDEVATLIEDLGAESPEAPQRVSDQLSLLKGLMGELSGPKESSEISLLILRLGAEYFERAVLFLVKPDAVAGFGGFGETGDSEKMIEKVRHLTLPLDGDTVVHQALHAGATVVRSSQSFTSADEALCRRLGVHVPQECAAIPMISRGRVVTLLYGDNAFSGEPLKDLTGIEIFITQAGLALERALLEMQLLNLKRAKDERAS